jgi:carbamoyltransferase
MGMAPYGEPKYVDRIMKMIRINDDGSLWHGHEVLRLPLVGDELLHEEFEEAMGTPAPRPALEDKSLDPFYCDVAMSIQKVTETIVLKMASHLHKTTGLKALCMAGGVALNSVANAKIIGQTGIEELYVIPAAGDDGGSVGAALWACHHVLGIPRAGPLEHAYLGTEYSDAEIKAFLDKNGITYTHIANDEQFFDSVSDDLIGARWPAGSAGASSSGRARSAAARSSPTAAARR